MVEKILMTVLAVIILAFFLTMGASGLLKPESGKRGVPLAVSIIMFIVCATVYLALVLNVLIPVLRR